MFLRYAKYMFANFAYYYPYHILRHGKTSTVFAKTQKMSEGLAVSKSGNLPIEISA